MAAANTHSKAKATTKATTKATVSKVPHPDTTVVSTKEGINSILRRASSTRHIINPTSSSSSMVGMSTAAERLLPMVQNPTRLVLSRSMDLSSTDPPLQGNTANSTLTKRASPTALSKATASTPANNPVASQECTLPKEKIAA